MTFSAGRIGGSQGKCSAPFPLFGSIPGAQVFQRTFGFTIAAAAILRTRASEIRRGGAAARRSAGFGIGGTSLRTGCPFSLITAAAGGGSAFGFGNAPIAGFLRGLSTG